MWKIISDIKVTRRYMKTNSIPRQHDGHVNAIMRIRKSEDFMFWFCNSHCLNFKLVYKSWSSMPPHWVILLTVEIQFHCALLKTN